jgi:hypothetical protein
LFVENLRIFLGHLFARRIVGLVLVCGVAVVGLVLVCGVVVAGLVLVCGVVVRLILVCGVVTVGLIFGSRTLGLVTFEELLVLRLDHRRRHLLHFRFRDRHALYLFLEIFYNIRQLLSYLTYKI